MKFKYIITLLALFLTIPIYAKNRGGTDLKTGAHTPITGGTISNPTLVDQVNITSAGFTSGTYKLVRVNNIFFISAEFSINATGAGNTSFDIATPITSNFTSSGDCSGGFNNGNNSESGVISADPAQDQIRFTIVRGAGGNIFYYFTAMCTIK